MIFLSILILYIYTFLVSFLLIVLMGWMYKLENKNKIVHGLSKIVVWLCFLFSMYAILAIEKYLGSNDDDILALNAVICLIVYMAAWLYAIAKNDKNAHKKVSFRFKRKR